MTPWPGNGLQIAVELSQTDPPPAAPWLEDPNGETLSAVLATPAPEPGISAVLVVPAGDPAIHAQRIAAATAVLNALPAEESVLLENGLAIVKFSEP